MAAGDQMVLLVLAVRIPRVAGQRLSAESVRSV
jgi:hypothetical protein